jgi:AraC-like DNA-binding protein
VARAWHVLAATGGATPIGRVAAEVGWSHKHLITRFRQQVGMPPKTAARLMRFDRMVRRLTDRPARWPDIAAASGYADQAHFIREFREFTGTTPAAYVARASAITRRRPPRSA